MPGEWRLYAVGGGPAPQPGTVGRLDEAPHVPLGGRALLAFARRAPRLSSRLMRRRAHARV